MWIMEKEPKRGKWTLKKERDPSFWTDRESLISALASEMSATPFRASREPDLGRRTL